MAMPRLLREMFDEHDCKLAHVVFMKDAEEHLAANSVPSSQLASISGEVIAPTN
jgi:hypothetical protein